MKPNKIPVPPKTKAMGKPLNNKMIRLRNMNRGRVSWKNSIMIWF
jgi:hypothetical protein